MPNSRSVTALLLVLVGALGVSMGIALSQPARADSPRTPVCTWSIPNAPVTVASEKALIQENDALQAWMASQTAAGRADFILVPSRLSGHASLCAW